MGSRKRAKKKKSFQPPALTAEEQATIAAILQGVENSDPAEFASRLPDSRHAQAIVEQLRLESSTIRLLMAIRERFGDKNVRKAIKRVLFKLKQRGFQVEEYLKPESAPSSILKSPRLQCPEVYVGPVLDMSGSRAVVITHYRTMKAPHVGAGLVSDRGGIYDFLYGPFSKKKTRQMKEDLSGFAGPLVETSLSHAATILEHAYQRHVENHPGVSREYLDLRPWLLQNAPLLDHPVIYDVITRDQTGNKGLTNSDMEKLFQHKLMEKWRIEPERLMPYMEELMKTDKSPIILTEAQKSDQAGRIKERCMEELFPFSERILLRQRLEEMAFIFFKLEKEDYFRRCLDAAGTIDREDGPMRRNPVIDFFLEQNLSYYTEMIQGGISHNTNQTEEAFPDIILP